MTFDRDFHHRHRTEQIVSGYANLVEDRISAGWDAYLLTFLFHDLRGPARAIVRQMEAEATRTYKTALTRIVRDPRKTPSDRLPLWLLSPDFPVPKRSKDSLRDVALNGGVHLGGIALLPPKNRLELPLEDHFINCRHLYHGRGSCLRRVHAEPVIRTPRRAVRYTFKALKHGWVDYDDLLVFPFASAELP